MKLNKFLIDQYHNYEQKFEKAKTRLSLEFCNVFIFRDLTVWVTSFALKTINVQFKRLKDKSIVIVLCIDIFTKTIRMLCAHKIQKQ